ncbi:hypothetical protein KYG33_00910 [Chryseobacterium sp. D764]|uniref:hypothetical protein n=1 Tax=unclassified Chryseobacterium TaxID=2593645 RepID=UPI000987C65A|nr:MULTISPECIES: hypothetical protein [unclassified Chryseobacterium]QXU49639.1 hypothetical protein KYG33_00910 [Chryseobacterium sp. D764]
MKKQITLLGTLLISSIVFSQVGINTDAPKSTLDVVGKAADTSSLDGIIAPRITGNQLRAKVYTTDQTGVLVYVTAADTAPSGQTVDVISIGYYYFNGIKWKSTGSDINIYKANGSLAGTRTLSLNSNVLNFTGTDQKTFWSADGSINQNNLLSSSGLASMAFYGGNNANLYIQQFRSGTSQIIASGSNTNLLIGTGGTDAPSYIRFDTSAGSGAVGTGKMFISSVGNVGIGNNNTSTEKLDVIEGTTRIRQLPFNGASNAINTTPGGTASTNQDQTFTATRTVVADANGVLGYVTGLPTTGGGTAPSGSINVGETISQVYSIPASTTNVNTFNLNTYIMANSLPVLPVLDGLRIDIQGVNGSYYDPRIYNVSGNTQLISYQSFATQVNENETSLNNSVATGGYVQVDSNNIVYWMTSAAEVETTNVQVQIDASTYRWYEFKWWCMEIGTGPAATKKIFLSITRKA